MPNLTYHNVKIVRYGNTNQVAVKGEVTNNAGRPFSAVAVRIVLFINNITIANVVFTLNGVPNGANKEFEMLVPDLDYDQVAKDINRFEVYTESTY